MTDRLKEIRERLGKATKGEWFNDNDYRVKLGSINGETLLETKHFIASEGHDCDFIAHSKSDIEYLLSEVERKDEALGKIEANVNCMRSSMDVFIWTFLFVLWLVGWVSIVIWVFEHVRIV